MAAGRNNRRGGGRQGGGTLRQRAVRDVQLQNQPAFDYNNAQLQQAQENYLRAQQAAQSASGGAYDMIGGAERPHFQQIADQFTQNLNALAPEFGGAGSAVNYAGATAGMPTGEVAAANAVGGAIGSAGLSALSNDASRWGMSREGAQQEATIFGRNTEAALRQQMLDTIQQHENEQQNLMAQQPWAIKQRMDELKDQAIEQQLARSKMRSDAAFSEALQARLTGMLDNGRGNRGPGNGPGGGRVRDSYPDPRGPQGPLGTPGNVGGDTAAGGNQGTVSSAGLGIPDAWQRADRFRELPWIVRQIYNREPGQSLADWRNSWEALGSGPGGGRHPSFANSPEGWQDFIRTYRRFLPEINQLARQTYMGPG